MPTLFSVWVTMATMLLSATALLGTSRQRSVGTPNYETGGTFVEATKVPTVVPMLVFTLVSPRAGLHSPL